jgi:hypothetical protein
MQELACTDIQVSPAVACSCLHTHLEKRMHKQGACNFYWNTWPPSIVHDGLQQAAHTPVKAVRHTPTHSTE